MKLSACRVLGFKGSRGRRPPEPFCLAFALAMVEVLGNLCLRHRMKAKVCAELSRQIVHLDLASIDRGIERVAVSPAWKLNKGVLVVPRLP